MERNVVRKKLIFYTIDIAGINNSLTFAVLKESGHGVIGSRARLRIWCREAWGFESLQPHKTPLRHVLEGVFLFSYLLVR